METLGDHTKSLYVTEIKIYVVGYIPA